MMRVRSRVSGLLLFMVFSLLLSGCLPRPSVPVIGEVLDSAGRPVPGVAIDLSLDEILTDENGRWNQPAPKYPVMVTPRKDGWTFSPEKLEWDGTTKELDFTAYKVASGRVVDPQGNGVKGVTMRFGGSATVETNAQGYWSATGLPGVLTVTPAKTKWVFSPSSKSLGMLDHTADFTGYSDVDLRQLLTMTNLSVVESYDGHLPVPGQGIQEIRTYTIEAKIQNDTQIPLKYEIDIRAVKDGTLTQLYFGTVGPHTTPAGESAVLSEVFRTESMGYHGFVLRLFVHGNGELIFLREQAVEVTK